MSGTIDEKVLVFVRKRPENNKYSEISDSDEIAVDSTASSMQGELVYKYERNSIKKTSTDTQKIQEKLFKFNEVFDINSTQDDIFQKVAKPLVDSVIKGYSCTILAYGQTSSGKTFTMRGESNDESTKGITTRSMEHLLISNNNSNTIISVSYFEIYCDVLTDLLINSQSNNTEKTENPNLTIRETKEGKVYVEGLIRIQIESIDQFNDLLSYGDQYRATATTNANETSSRSHAICLITLTDNILKSQSNLILVDLAGSERSTASEGQALQRFEEMKSINSSLSALGNVIHALSEGKKHIPYRDSKLTRILQVRNLQKFVCLGVVNF